MYDYHIHMYSGRSDTPQEFMQKTALAGITGGGIISPIPQGYLNEDGVDQRWQTLLDQVFEFTSETPGFLPVFWIDPTDKDIEIQIKTAVERGIAGFKIICNHYYPKEVLKVIEMIGETGVPLNFHCGILYSPHPAAKFNRPQEFECLMELKRLRFSLAHAGWPWTDEYNSIIGEFSWLDDYNQIAGKPDRMEAYVDLTPGTPRCYRRDVLRKLCLCGFGSLKTHTLWGSDQPANNYDYEAVADLIARDRKIFAEIAADMKDYVVQGCKGPDYSDLWEHISKSNMETFFRR